MRMKKIVIAFCPVLLFLSTSFSQQKYEFRAAWVATVDNIDWPSKGNYNSDSQRAEFIHILDMHQRNGMNAVIVQVRPATDAFYPSQYEPWSEWLTGRQGQPPSPYYDPLQFMIEETHKRGMEFHAWCNPYRAVFKIGESSIASTHVTRLHPNWFLNYGDTKYFDPGNKEVQQYVATVIRDIVHRYDIDAIHFDDYFYPYRIPGKEFPDDASYKKYGNGMTKDEWRRSNVDSIIVLLGKVIKEEKSYCKFGISPFGVWRNKDKDMDGSDTHAGQTNYDDLYADIVLWLKNGWIDYVAPQLYWEFGHKVVPYEVLLDWWAKHSYGRQCYIGLGIYRAGSNAAWRDKTLLPRQIDAIRKTPNVQGMIFFSSKSFEKNPYGWNDSLQNNYFKVPAIVPPMNWLDTSAPAEPFTHSKFNKQDSVMTVFLGEKNANDELRGFVIYRTTKENFQPDSTAIFQIVPYQKETKCMIRTTAWQYKKGFAYYVTALNRLNIESKPVFLFSLTQ
ncbi:MAG: family 10 glycosylhydrolase [Bacteroidetes bacterium]|nr:family 10 glycosylhydrolase [Bacteroidota bacterium]MBS1934425.1 family 10 glycosylhydrolase [Bacteroidota bacterium]